MAIKRPIVQKSHFIPVSSDDMLHLRRIHRDPEGTPVFMLHGAIENGRIFYSESGKGLAPYLAGKGFDVFVADLRGRGASRPRLNRSSRYGQTEAITEDIPALINAIIDLRGEVPQHWLAHSWGGVLLSSYLARFPGHRRLVSSLVYFGTKRSVQVKNLDRFLMIDLGWRWLFTLVVGVIGYLPADKLKIGSDNETVKSHNHSKQWVKAGPWIDPDDGFDYASAIKQIKLPPAWYIAAEGDRFLGHPQDVQRFIVEAGDQDYRYTVLSRKNGNLHDYGHINMLTHPDAALDHFPKVAAWLAKDSR